MAIDSSLFPDPKEIVIGGSVAVKHPFYVERIKAVLNAAHKKNKCIFCLTFVITELK